MRLSKLYSNKDTIFPPIKFNRGLNIVFATIKHPKDNDKDNHNLGKTLLIHLIDFMLLKGVKKDFFLKKHEILFDGFEFYLEIELNKDSHITIKRCVKQNTKISFVKHNEAFNNFVYLDDWQQNNIPIEKAKQLLDGYLNLSSIQPFSYRKGIGYFLRNQTDYMDVFQLNKMRGKHKEWKPYIAQLLGFDSSVITEKYDVKADLDERNNEKRKLRTQIFFDVNEYNRLKGEISLQQQEIYVIEQKLDTFDYHEQEININQELVDEIEVGINDINLELYNTRYDLGKINTAFSENVQFDINEIQQIFEEAKFYFSEQLVKDYNALITFNKKMTQERHTHLKERKIKLEEQQQKLTIEHETLSKKRQEYLSLLQEADFFEKYKKLQRTLDNKRADILLLEKQLTILEQIKELDNFIHILKEKDEDLSTKIQQFVEEDNSKLDEIRTNFNHVIETVLAVKAQPFVIQNKEGNLDFKTAFISKIGEHTSESDGYTYKKLLCIAFDLAVLKMYASESFFHFVYHDGALDQLDNRKKINLLKVIREYCEQYNIQYILTIIDTDLPRNNTDNKIPFSDKKIIRKLHDDGDNGRLFKMPIF